MIGTGSAQRSEHQVKTETVIAENDLSRHMSKRNALVFLVIVCLALILVAGCTSSTTTTSAPAGAGAAATTTQVSTPAAAASQDPIVGKWSITGASGNSAQVVFGADGSFTGYLNGGSQVMRSGTWQNIGGGKYTVTIKGQSAPVTWVLDATSNTAYNAAYPTLVYSPVS